VKSSLYEDQGGEKENQRKIKLWDGQDETVRIFKSFVANRVNLT
jgi:hypothetical protein